MPGCREGKEGEQARVPDHFHLSQHLSLTWLALRDRTQGCQELRAHSQRERKVEKCQQGLGRGPSSGGLRRGTARGLVEGTSAERGPWGMTRDQ